MHYFNIGENSSSPTKATLGNFLKPNNKVEQLAKELATQIQCNEILMSATQPHPNKRAKVAKPLIAVADGNLLNAGQIIASDTPAIAVAHHELGDGQKGLLTSGYSQVHDINRKNTAVPPHTQTFGNPFMQSLVVKAGYEAEKQHREDNHLDGKYKTRGEWEVGQRKREEAEKVKVEELK